MALTGRHFEVTPPLSEIVKHFYAIQSSSDFVATIAHLSPNYEMMLVFNFGSPVRASFAADPPGSILIGKIALLGPLKKMLNYEVLPATDMLITVFNLDGFYRLFQVAVDSLNSNQVHHPDILMPTACSNELWEVLSRISNQEERVQVLQEYVQTFNREADSAAKLLREGSAYFNDSLLQPVKAIAADAGLSERTIQLRFKKYVGYSPKELLRFLRFKQVIRSIEQYSGAQINWFDLIYDFGYHDQSHLIKDFQHFLGTSPETFVKQILGKEFCVTRPGQFDR
ncbi:helix-turn-helix domain-containing protein [Chitinophaga sp. 30R24]|uniref:AraC family transcriptional regulator n=1 Tax=Chitinophaga sp. 30R24 TaxID=3248838 RepID=UPI003B90E335